MTFGLPTDASGFPVIDGKPIDVSSGGVSKVQDVIERTWPKVRASALDDAESYFRENPDRIPDPRAVDSGFEAKAGGPLGQVTLFQHEGELFDEVRGIYIPVRQ
jgi:hypothetical protein